MGHKQNGSTSKKQATDKSARPVLFISCKTVSDNALLVQHLLSGFVEQGISAVLVCPPGCNVDRVAPPSVDVIVHPFFEVPLLGRPNRNLLVTKLEKFKPTVLHCLCPTKARLTRLIAASMDIPYVISIDSVGKRWLPLASSKRCAAILVPTPTIAAGIAKKHPRFADRIRRINPGVFVEQQINCFDDTTRLSSIVTPGPVSSVDEVACLLSAVRHLAIDGYEFMLIMINQGKRADTRLRGLIRDQGLSHNIVIVPNIEPVRAVLSACDILVLSRRGDSFNPLLLEAMAVGTAVAAPKAGADELIVEDETSLLFDPEDELSVYSVLQRLLDTRELARKLAGNAQQYLRKNNSVAEMVNATIETYQKARQWYKP